MLTQEEQAQILRKADLNRRHFYARRLKVLRGEMSPKRSEELRERDDQELKNLLKEVG